MNTDDLTPERLAELLAERAHGASRRSWANVTRNWPGWYAPFILEPLDDE